MTVKLTNRQKCETYKDTIYKLYSKEGRTIKYISELLGIERHYLSRSIKGWGFPDPKNKDYLKPSTRKFLNKNRELIKSKLDKDVPVSEIARELNISQYSLYHTLIPSDPVLSRAWKENRDRLEIRKFDEMESNKENSYFEYDFEDLPGEEWKEILGYPNYQISNYGRCKGYAEMYDSWYLKKSVFNKKKKREYIVFPDPKTGKRKSLNFARLVAFAFCEGHSEERNIVNHIDGDTHNNKASNLEWVTQSENVRHAYDVLGVTKDRRRKNFYSKIIYKGEYEFKTAAALARFLGVSTMTVSQYMKNPEKYNLEIIP